MILDESIFDQTYRGYDIEYDVYGEGEYTVQVDGDDLWFRSLEEAKKGIDELIAENDDYVRESLNEENTLPDALPAEPIEVSTEVIEPQEVPTGPEEGNATGIAELLMNLIKDELEAIQGYNTFLANITDEFDYLRPTIEHINAEENKHVGELQYLLQEISPNAQNIDLGQKEAEEETEGEVKTPVLEDVKFWEIPGYNAIDIDNTEGRAYRIKKYKDLCGLAEDFIITEDNLDEEAIKQISCYDLVTPEKLRAELLGQEWGE